MQREREQPASELKCPWCHTAAGTDTVTCPRDRTVLHRDCVHEFGVCPICHLEVDDEAAPTSEADAPSLRVELPASHWHVPPLPREVRRLGREIRALYPRARLWPAFGVAALTGIALALAQLWALIAIPLLVVLALAVHRRLRPTGPTAEGLLRRARLPAPNTTAAVELAQGDRRALNALQTHRGAHRAARRATARVRQLVDRRRAIYRTWLANRTPIEEVQQISGIGPGLAQLLRRAGITNLRQLSARQTALRQLDGIGPQRARALRAWVADREAALDRLVEGEQFPGREEIDSRLEAALAAARSAGSKAAEAGAKAASFLTGWLEEREALLSTLCLTRYGGRRAPPGGKRTG